MKHHEVIVDFNTRGMLTLFKRLLTRPPKAEPAPRDEPEGLPVRWGL